MLPISSIASGEVTPLRCAPRRVNSLFLYTLGDPQIKPSAPRLLSCLLSRSRAAPSMLSHGQATVCQNSGFRVLLFAITLENQPLPSHFPCQWHWGSILMFWLNVLHVLSPLSFSLSHFSMTRALASTAPFLPFLPHTMFLHFLFSSMWVLLSL